MSLPPTIDPKYHVEADRIQASLDYVREHAYDPATLYPPCKKCGLPLTLKRVQKIDSPVRGCFFVSCPTQDCSKAMWLKYQAERLIPLGLPREWFACLTFKGFPDVQAINPNAIPAIPGWK